MRRLIRWLFVIGLVAVMAIALSNQNSSPQPQTQPQPFSGPLPTPTPIKEVGFVGVVQVTGAEGLMIQTTDKQLVTFVVSGSVDPIKIGDKVAVWAWVRPSDMGMDIYVLTKIQLIPTSPTRIHYVGTIKSDTDDKIVVTGLQGEETPFRVDLTLQRLPEGYMPAGGDKVTVVAKPDPLAGSGWLAIAVVKQ